MMGEYAGWYIDGTAELMDAPQAVSTTFAEVTGHGAMTFAEWAVANVHGFR